MLSQRAGPEADSAAIAAAALQLHNELAACLAPIIGLTGVTAVAGRSLHLTQLQFPWLGLELNPGTHDPTLAEVRDNPEQLPVEVATEAAVALLDGFGSLLTTFIGAGLTTRLLRQAWPHMVPGDTVEERSR